MVHVCVRHLGHTPPSHCSGGVSHAGGHPQGPQKPHWSMQLWPACLRPHRGWSTGYLYDCQRLAVGPAGSPHLGAGNCEDAGQDLGPVPIQSDWPTLGDLINNIFGSTFVVKYLICYICTVHSITIYRGRFVHTYIHISVFFPTYKGVALQDPIQGKLWKASRGFLKPLHRGCFTHTEWTSGSSIQWGICEAPMDFTHTKEAF